MARRAPQKSSSNARVTQALLGIYETPLCGFAKKCRTAPLCGVACSAGGSWRRDGVRVASGAKLAEPSDSFKNNQMHDLFPILSKRDFLSDPAMRGVEFHNL